MNRTLRSQANPKAAILGSPTVLTVALFAAALLAAVFLAATLLVACDATVDLTTVTSPTNAPSAAPPEPTDTPVDQSDATDPPAPTEPPDATEPPPPQEPDIEAALREAIERELGSDLDFDIARFKVVGDWAGVNIDPNDPGLDPLALLLTREGSGWRVVDYGTGYGPEEWMASGAPQEIADWF